MKKFCESIRKQRMDIINFRKKKNDVINKGTAKKYMKTQKSVSFAIRSSYKSTLKIKNKKARDHYH